jgi:hypothetical protein
VQRIHMITCQREEHVRRLRLRDTVRAGRRLYARALRDKMTRGKIDGGVDLDGG